MEVNHFVDLLVANKDEVYSMPVKGWQVPILHGLIALAADHPGIKYLGHATHEVITDFRGWCRTRFAEWGFSPGEVDYLDKMREEYKLAPSLTEADLVKIREALEKETLAEALTAMEEVLAYLRYKGGEDGSQAR